MFRTPIVFEPSAMIKNPTDYLQILNIFSTPGSVRAHSVYLSALMAAEMDNERGERIALLISEQGWEISHLARLIRVDRKAIYDWLKGGGISSEALERLAVALETTRRFIQTGDGPAHHPRGAAPAVLLRQLADDLEAPASQDE